MRILFLGPPAAGKGTQAKMIQSRTGIPLLVMGDILREAIQKQDELGKQVEQYVKQGTLVPDPLIIKTIIGRLEDKTCQNSGFLLDGFPRTLEQAHALESAMVSKKMKLDYAIYYKIEDKIAIDRISGRRTCKSCGAVFHITNNPPKKANVCDTCLGELYQRPDDKEEVMKTRLAAYHEKTTPLLAYYRQKGILIEIDANRAIEMVLEDTVKKIKLAK